MSEKKVSEDTLLKAAKATLDDSVNHIDDDVRARLDELRREAIKAAQQCYSKQGHSKQGHRKQGQEKQVASSPWLLPAGGLALLALTIGVLSITLYPSKEGQPVIADVEDLQLLTAPENLELYEELDFYQWLAEQNEGLG